jgi:membrane dipeptidase
LVLNLVVLAALTQVPLEVDLHQHLTMRHALRLFHGEPDDGSLASSASDSLTNMIESAGLRAAGIETVVAVLWPPFATRPGSSAFQAALREVEALRDFAARRPAFALATDEGELEQAKRSGRIGVLIGLEGAEAVTQLEQVDLLYAAGVRVVGLVHFTDNAIADADDDQFSPALGVMLNGASGGLTAFGKLAVERMLHLGMVVDVAHASEATIDDVLRLAEARGAPVIFSHAGSNMRAPRQPNDAQAAAIARFGGMIGVGVFRSPLLKEIPQEDQWPGFQAAGCDAVLSHWAHLARVAGEGAVSLGSDFNSFIARPERGGACPKGLRNTTDLPALSAALAARGLSATGSRARLLTLLRTLNAQADPVAQARARRLHQPPPGSLFEAP